MTHSPRRGAGAYWALRRCETRPADSARAPEGLSSADAAERLREYGPNELREHHRCRGSASCSGSSAVRCCCSWCLPPWRRRCPASGSMRPSCSPSSWRPWASATRGSTARRRLPPRLRARVRVRANVLRDGRPAPVPIEQVVPGDVVLLVGRQSGPGRRRRPRGDGLLRQRSGADRRELSGREAGRHRRRSPPVSPSARNCVFLGTNVRSGTARCLVVSDRAGDRVRRDRASPDASAAGDRVRPRDPPLRLSAHERDADHGAAGLRRAHVPRPAAGRDAAVRRRAGRRAQPRAAAGDPQRQPGARRPDDGAARRAGPPAERDREPRQHGRAVHRQDRHAHRGRRPARGRVRRSRRSRRPRCSSSAPAMRRSRPGIASPLDDAILKAANARSRRGVRKLAEIPFDFVRKRVTRRGRARRGRAADHQGRLPPRARGLHALGRRHARSTPPRARSSSSAIEEWSRQGIRVLAVAAASGRRASRATAATTSAT